MSRSVFQLFASTSRAFGGAPREAAENAVHFLHIGKNAGTELGRIIDRLGEADTDVRIVKEPHRVRLSDIPRDAPYFFSIRKPVNRFRSGFYSRMRKGQPQYYSEWSDHEERAFAVFEHANDLAEALFSDGRRGRDATAAMKSITHVSMNQVDWFSRLGFALDVRPPIWIVRTEQFEADLARLLARLGVTTEIDLPPDPMASHAFDYSGVPALSDLARSNLERWYAQDMAFYAMCDAWLDEQTDSGELS